MVNDSVREELKFKVSPMAKTARVEAEKAEIISKAEKARAEIWSRTLPPSVRATMTTATSAAGAKNTTVTSSAKPAEPAGPPPIPEPPKPLVSPPPVTTPPVSATPNIPAETPPAAARHQPAPPVQTPATPKLSIATTKPHTMEFVSKPTSPTLKEFQNKNAVLPEWRLQLQNSVRKRNGSRQTDEASSSPASIAAAPPRQTFLVTSGATALKAEPVEETEPAAAETVSNPTLAKALQRIEQSRRKYSVAEEKPRPQLEIVPSPQPQPKTYPYTIAKPNAPQEFAAAPKQPAVQTAKAHSPHNATKPKPAAPVAAAAEAKGEKFDTNKLPPLPSKVVSSFENRPVELTRLEENTVEEKKIKAFQIKAATAEAPDVVAYAEPAAAVFEEGGAELEEVSDDRAPLALRFNAALFDLIIGSFLSVVLLAPFMLSSGNLFTLQGLFAFLATCSIVMFIYLTTTIGTMGRTFGMKLFSLELIDIEENAYPTFHQAAVNSSVYLVSLALGGLGFLTLFLNHEKRAAHDLLSGTIVVREYE